MTPGDTNGIVVINQLQPITVIFTIPEDNVTALMQRTARRRHAAGRGIRPHQQRQARRRQAADGRQLRSTSPPARSSCARNSTTPTACCFPISSSTFSCLQELLHEPDHHAQLRGAPRRAQRSRDHVRLPGESPTTPCHGPAGDARRGRRRARRGDRGPQRPAKSS